MRVQTRYGNEIEIISAETDKEGTWVKVRRKEDGVVKEVRMSDLRCDDFLDMMDAIGQVTTKK